MQQCEVQSWDDDRKTSSSDKREVRVSRINQSEQQLESCHASDEAVDHETSSDHKTMTYLLI